MRRNSLAATACAILLTLIGREAVPGRRQGAAPPGASILALEAPPLRFVENRGQSLADGEFYVQGRDLRLAFGPRGVAITQYGEPSNDARYLPRRPGVAVEVIDGQLREIDPPRRISDTVHLEFIGARPGVRPVGRDRAPTVVSYFQGPPEAWLTGLATFRELVYTDLWPGIDLLYRAEGDQVKATFIVQPGADPSAIRLAWRGAAAVEIDAEGAMVVTTKVGRFRDEAPTAWQEDGRRRDSVPARHAVVSASGVGPHGGPGERSAGEEVMVGFALGAYHSARVLVIDPAIFVYGGFFGGPDNNRGLGIAVDGAGSAYFCGETVTDRGDRDAYVVKVSADGTHYVYIAYIGGRATDTCFDVGVDATGAAYLTGVAGSNAAAGFPVTLGPDLTHNGGGDDTLVAKLDPSGTDLVYAGYLGGSGFDFGEGIRVAPDGSAYLSGIAGSREMSFPAVVGPDLSHNGGRFDAYICKLKPVPNAPEPKDNYDYCGFVGGGDDDVGRFGNGVTAGHVAVDANGNAYSSGMTRSTEASFPDGDGFGDLPGPDRTHNGDWDAWVVKVRADGTGLLYAGYLGGKEQDEGYGAGVDAEGAFYFTGSTMSRHDFPAVVGPDLTYNGGVSDAFVAKVAPDGSHYEYVGFIGGECRVDCGPDTDEMGVGLTVDAEGHAYPIGWTYGAGTSFPTVGGPDLTPNGALVSLPDDDGASGDAWVGRVKRDPSADAVTDNFDFLGYIGGHKWDAAFWVALDGRGGIYVAGDTESDETTFPSGDGLAGLASPRRGQPGGAPQAFVAKVTFEVPAASTMTPRPTRTPGPNPRGLLLLPRVLRGQ